jgi:hypothetical protein
MGHITLNGDTGATTQSRWVGAVTGSAPASGTFNTGDFVFDTTGGMWVCTSGGTPGTWVKTGTITSVGVTAPITSTGGSAPTIGISAATDSAAGSMSAADKTKLDGMTAGAAVASVSGSAPIVSSGGTTPAISITAASISAAGSQSSSNVQKQRLFLDPIADYGAKFDHRVTFDGACSTGTPGVITSATINFTSADVGKRILLTGAGASGALYVGTISSLNSSSSVNVSPSISTTVSSKGLQVHTDDLTAWTNLITDINAATYPGAVVKIEMPLVTTLTSGETWQTSSTFTGRSGISAALPTINKQITIIGYGGAAQTDIGDYTKAGGACIAYCGGSLWSGFGAVMTIAPVAGASNQALKAVRLQSFWVDCRNGDAFGYQGLKGISLQSVQDSTIDDIFIMDPAAVGLEMLPISPGTAGALGEAKDCTRNTIQNYHCRVLDAPSGAVTTPFTMTSAVALTTTGQSLTVAANSLPTAGFIWVMTNNGYPVLVQYTGGGGTTTLTGCVVSAQDAINTPTTVNGSDVVSACPGNGCAILLDGDTTANACLNLFNTVIIEHGTTFGPAAVCFRNSDSNEFHNLVINGGSATVISATNRVTKPGVRFNGSNTTFSLSARNNIIYSSSPGVGGCSVMSLTAAGALLLSPAVANGWDRQQLANGEPLPTVETVATSGTQGPAGSYFANGSYNGGFSLGIAGPVAVATQSIASATTALILGSVVAVPPQGLQVGTTFRWTIPMSKTAAGVAARTVSILYGTHGSTADGVIATTTVTPSSTATADQGKMILELTVATTGSSGTGLAQLTLMHNALPSATTGGLSTVGTNQITMTMSAINTTLPASQNMFLSVLITTGTSEVLTILPPCYCECIWAGNPAA